MKHPDQILIIWFIYLHKNREQLLVKGAFEYLIQNFSFIMTIIL